MSFPIVEEEGDNDDGIDQICHSGEILKSVSSLIFKLLQCGTVVSL